MTVFFHFRYPKLGMYKYEIEKVYMKLEKETPSDIEIIMKAFFRG